LDLWHETRTSTQRPDFGLHGRDRVRSALAAFRRGNVDRRSGRGRPGPV